jgi:hypothetical protein
VLVGVERRVNRRQYPLDEPDKVRRQIQALFPKNKLDGE